MKRMKLSDYKVGIKAADHRRWWYPFTERGIAPDIGLVRTPATGSFRWYQGIHSPVRHPGER